jgi:hypothetical protein
VAARSLIGIADADTDMRLPSAAAATILMARAFMGHSLLVCPSRNKPANPELTLIISRGATGGRSRSVEK